jgi:uncharacterized membrane protein
MNYVFVFAFGIGVVSGLRSMTAPAVVAWAVKLGWLKVSASPLAFMGSTAAVALFSLGAIGELIADKLPQMSKRTAAFPLIARIVFGGLCGACLCVSAHQSIGIGAICGAIGGIAGAFAGYEVRRRLVLNLKMRDFPVAVVEDLIAVGFAFLFVSR